MGLTLTHSVSSTQDNENVHENPLVTPLCIVLMIATRREHPDRAGLCVPQLHGVFGK